MASYPYKCTNCTHEFVDVMSMSEYERKTTCPKCDKETLHRVIGTSAISFKGSGFTPSNIFKSG